MTRKQRQNFNPINPTQILVDTITKDWDSASERINQIPGEAVDMINRTGNFLFDAVTNTVDEMRDVYDASNQTYNLITDIIETPCEDKWNVIIETAIPAAGSSLWLLLTPNPGEMLEEYLSPKGSRKGGRGGRDTKNKYRQKGKSGKIRRRWPALPHVDSLIADRLPGAQAVQGRNIGAGQRFLFEGIDLADRALWYFLLMDVAENFFVKWNSGIMESRFCTRQFDYLATANLIEAVPFDSLNNFNSQENWEYSADKGVLHLIQPVVRWITNVTGQFNVAGQIVWEDPVEIVTSDPFFAIRAWDGDDLLFSQIFELDIQEGQTSIDFGGSIDFEGATEIDVAFGNVNTFPDPTLFTAGQIMAFGVEAE